MHYSISRDANQQGRPCSGSIEALQMQAIANKTAGEIIDSLPEQISEAKAANLPTLAMRLENCAYPDQCFSERTKLVFDLLLEHLREKNLQFEETSAPAGTASPLKSKQLLIAT